ncbi:MAG TPA: sulfatase [Nocardioides sp.]|uniref:sulfatase family protein n=1 Tax=Nocardioides sp. TaxID=35761 RepID=UPI002D7E1970|nr:sulfatase [Nocardioides sp.]HET6653300.1 sulfatase [Nocardioides sp.]
MRRVLLVLAVIGAALLTLGTTVVSEVDAAASGEAAPASLAAGQPNVVVITLDDMREDDLRFMPRTQALVGGQGVTFDNAFSPYPLCCPSRSSFLTGLYTHNHKVWSHQEPWGFQALRDQQTLPVWLQAAGYDTVFLGKYLNGYGTQPAPDGSAPDSKTYVPPGWTDWRGAIDGGLEAGHPQDGGTYRFFNTTLNDDGQFYLEPGRYQSEVFGDLTAGIVAEQAGDDRPFFLWANYVAPHHGNPDEPDDPKPITRDDGKKTRFVTTARPARVKGMFDAQVTEAPGAAGEDDVSDKPFFVRELPPLNAAELAGLLEVTRQRAESLAVVDEQVEKTVAALAATGELDDTLVIVTSDNGYFLGEHRIRQGKVLPYEPALAVPLLVRGPGIPAGEVRTDPFTTVDVAPTVLSAAGTTVDWPLDGKDLLGVARSGDRGWRRAVLTETGPRGVVADLDESGPELKPRDPGPDAKRFSQGIRTARYLYVEHASGETELYDMAVDPDQLDSVAGDPAYAEDQAALARVLDKMRGCRAGACSAPMPRSLRAG